jgi:hypothetical protein
VLSLAGSVVWVVLLLGAQAEQQEVLAPLARPDWE